MAPVSIWDYNSTTYIPTAYWELIRATSTATDHFNRFSYYFAPLPPPPPPDMTLNQRARLALSATRVPPRPGVGTPSAGSAGYRLVRAPRRTTVSRATAVSFRRQGGRRPL